MATKRTFQSRHTIGSSSDSEGPPAPMPKKPALKKEKSQVQPEDTDKKAPPANPPLPLPSESLLLQRDDTTRNLNRFDAFQNNHGLHVPKGAKQVYTPIRPALKHVRNMMARDNRDFRVSQVQQYNAPDHAMTSRPCWRITVQDHAVGVRNPITPRLCPTQQEATRLGVQACMILNRIPWQIDAATWQLNRVRMSAIRVFVELVALSEWQPDFDHMQLGEPYVSNDYKKRSFYLSSARVVDGDAKDNFRLGQNGPGYLFTNLAKGEKTPEQLVSLRSSEVDMPLVDRVVDVPNTFHYRCRYGGKRASANTGNGAAVVKLLRLASKASWGMIGTKNQLQTFLKDFLSAYSTKSEKGGYYTSGPLIGGSTFNNAHILQQPRVLKDGQMSMRLGKGAADVLRCKRNGSIEALNELDKKALSVILRSRNVIFAAYVHQQVHDSLRLGLPLDQVLLRAHAAGDAINKGLISPANVKERHLESALDPQNKDRPLACLHCTSPRQAIDMTVDEESRVLCFGCGRLATETNDIMSYTVKQRLGYRASSVFSSDSQFYKPSWQTSDLIDSLSSLIVNDETWQDGFNGEVTIDDVAEMNRLILREVMAYNPNAMSIDNIYGYFKTSAPGGALRHPQGTTLIKHCEQMLKGLSLPAAMPWLRRTLELAQSVLDKPKVEGYAKDIEGEMKAFEAFADNAYMIRRYRRHSRKRRITEVATMTEAQFKVITAQMRSGIFTNDPSVKKYLDVRSAFTTPADFLNLRRGLDTPKGKPRKHFDMWTADEIAMILDRIDQIEKSHSRFNKHKLKIPRIKNDKAPRMPWPFRPGHMPRDVDWEWLFDYCLARYKIWDEECDEEHETEESPATILIEIIVQWFETGGKCHIFGFHMTPYTAHEQPASMGRGVAVFDNIDNYIRDILPGEAMRTGCTSLFPTDMEEDYDKARRTVVWESWKANSLRWCFPAGAKTIIQLKEAVLALKPETEWYDARKPASEYLASQVEFPKSIKDQQTEIANVISEALRDQGEMPEVDEDEERSAQQMQENEAMDKFDTCRVSEDSEVGEEEAQGASDVQMAGTEIESPVTLGLDRSEAEYEAVQGDGLLPQLIGTGHPLYGWVIRVTNSDGVITAFPDEATNAFYARAAELGQALAWFKGDLSVVDEDGDVVGTIEVPETLKPSFDPKTFAKLVWRPDGVQPKVKRLADDKHPAYKVAVDYGVFPDQAMAYVTTDNLFRTEERLGYTAIDVAVFDPDTSEIRTMDGETYLGRVQAR